jgi:hypothetical protein
MPQGQQGTVAFGLTVMPSRLAPGGILRTGLGRNASARQQKNGQDAKYASEGCKRTGNKSCLVVV